MTTSVSCAKTVLILGQNPGWMLNFFQLCAESSSFYRRPIIHRTHLRHLCRHPHLRLPGSVPLAFRCNPVGSGWPRTGSAKGCRHAPACELLPTSGVCNHPAFASWLPCDTDRSRDESDRHFHAYEHKHLWSILPKVYERIWAYILALKDV